MALIIVLNVVFAVFVVGGILALARLRASHQTAWPSAKLTERRRAVSRARRQRAPRFEPAYPRGSCPAHRGGRGASPHASWRPGLPPP